MIANLEYLALAIAAGVFLLVVAVIGLVVLVRLARSLSSRPASPAPGVFTTLTTPLKSDPGEVFVAAVADLQKAAAATKVKDIFSNHVVNPHLQPFQNLVPTPTPAPAPSEPPVPKA